jgi:glycosyltransferase involved in cell wall biosynthesis
LRVLTIAHNAVAPSNRLRIAALRSLPDIQVELLTPRWWHEEGRRVTVESSADWRVGRTLATGNGTRHVYLTGLLEAVRRFQPDVIDLFEEPFSLVALQTLLARNLWAPRAALVLYSAVNVSRDWHWPYRWIERLVLAAADGAHAPSSDVLPILRARGLAGPADVIPPGVDVDRFASASPMDLPSIPLPRVGFLGRFEAVKGLDVLLAAFRQLGTASTLLLVGDGTLRTALTGKNVHVLPAVSYEDVPRLLKALDVLVLPSVTILPLHREQFGRVLVEAMAAGVPVVGSSSGAIPEVIGDAGLVVPERDAAALAQAIERLLTDETLRTRKTEQGRQRVHERFAGHVVASQTVALFRSAMLHRRRARPAFEEARA